MKRIAWLTDIHQEFVHSPREIQDFLDSVAAPKPDCVLVGGDTSTANHLAETLLMLEVRLRVPVYFVLGNHDFYYGSIRQVRHLAEDLTRTHECLRWLPAAGIVELGPQTGLIGHDGWADGRLGKAGESQVMLSDYTLIDEFVGLPAQERFRQLNELGDEAADYLRDVLPPALQLFPNLLLLTHVPPFRESCWHEGHISGDEYLPHFTCKAVGDVLVRAMQASPGCSLTVLCGHTHGEGRVSILPNLHVRTGGAKYGQPRLQEMISVL
jgi:predicted phosphohydrolase